jgi:hypothetical protein
MEARLTFDIRATWQARMLIAAQQKREGVIAAVMLSVLAHNYDDALLPLLKILFPGFESITPPFLCSAGKVDKEGAVVADLVERTGKIVRNYRLYRDEIVGAVKRWVVADRRLDPAMDPKDPEAKRLVH